MSVEDTLETLPESEFGQHQDDAMEIELDAELEAQGLALLFQDEALMHEFCEFLSLRDMKCLRQVSGICNSVVCSNSKRRELSQATMSASWHTKTKGMNRETCLTWKYFALRRFKFFRYSTLFKAYWVHVAGGTLTHLSISDSSLECDGFAWILNNVPHLQSLVLSNTKLRDFTVQHKNRRRAFPQDGEGDGQFAARLKNIVMENTSYVESCFMNYLVHRTGTLTSFTLGNFFIQNPNESVVEQSSLGTRFHTFLPKLGDLLRRNASSMKKLTLKNNASQGSYFQMLVEINDPAIYLRELHVVFPKADYNPQLNRNNPPGSYYDTLINFLKERGRDLRVLSLQFNRWFENGDLDRILVPVRKSLTSLTVAFHGDLLQTEIEFENLIEMDNLETFELRDLKKLDVKVVKKVRAGIDSNREGVTDLLKPLVSKVSVNFLAALPNNVTSITIRNLMSPQGILNGLEQPQLARAAASFRNLTKFEFFGPWIHKPTALVNCVVHGMPRLRTLVLSDCRLFDMDITGLDYTAVMELRKSLEHLYGTTVPPGTADASYFQRSLEEIQMPASRASRPLLSKLTELEHLDLSRNPISDVSFLESIRNPRLKTLNLSFCSRVNNSALELISRNMPELEELNLRYVRKITKYGMCRVISGCKKLLRLYTTPKILEHDDGFLNYASISPNFVDIVRTSRSKSAVEHDDDHGGEENMEGDED